MADSAARTSGSRLSDEAGRDAADADAYLAGVIAHLAQASLDSSTESSIDSRDNALKLVGGARVVPPLPGGGLEDEGQPMAGSLPGSPVRRGAGGTVRSPIRSPTVPKSNGGEDSGSGIEPLGSPDADGSDSASSAVSDGSDGGGGLKGAQPGAGRGNGVAMETNTAKKEDEALHAAEAKLQPVISQAATWRTAAPSTAGVLAYTLFNFERPQITSPMVEHWCQADANLQALTDLVTRPVDKLMYSGAGVVGQVALAATACGVVLNHQGDADAVPGGLHVAAYGIQAFAARPAAEYGLQGAEQRPQSVYAHTIARLQRLAGAQHAHGQATPLNSSRGAEGGTSSAHSTPSREHSGLTLHGDAAEPDALSAELSHALVEIVPKSGQRGVHIHDADTELSFPLGIAAAQAASFAAAVSDLHHLPDLLSRRLSTSRGDSSATGSSGAQAGSGLGSSDGTAVSLLYPRMEQELQALENVEVHAMTEGDDARLPTQAEAVSAAAAERAAVKRSFRVMRVLAGGTPFADELLGSRTDEIARAAFSVFSTRSKGSPSHACALLQRLLQVQPERMARLISSDSQRYVGAMLPYLHHSPVADCLVQLVSLSHLHSSMGGAGPCADLSGGFRNSSPFGAPEPFGGMGGGLFGLSGSMAREKGMTNFDGTLPLYCSRGVPATLASRFKVWQSLASWGFLHVLASHVYLPEYGPCPEHVGNAADALMQIVRLAAADDRGDILLRPLGRVGCMQGGMLQGLLLGAVAPLPGIDHAPGQYCTDGTVPSRQTCCMRVMNELLSLSYSDTVPASGELGAAPQAAAPQVPGATVKQVENRVHKYAQSISSAVVAALPRLGAALARVHKVLHPHVSLVQGKSVGASTASKGAAGTGGQGTAGSGQDAGAAADAEKKKQKKKDKKKKKKAKEAAAAAAAASSTGGATGASTATANEGSDLDSDEEGEGGHDKAGDSKGTPSAPTTPITNGSHPSALPHTSSSASMVAHAGAHAHHGVYPPASPGASTAQLHPGHIYSAPFGTFRLNAAQLVAAVVARRETTIPKPEPLPRPPVLTHLLGGSGGGPDGSHSAGLMASPNSTTEAGARDRAPSAVGADSVSGTEGGQRIRGESVVSTSEALGSSAGAGHGTGGRGGAVAHSASSTPHGSHDGDHEDHSDDEDDHEGGKGKGKSGKGKKGKKGKGKGKGRHSTGSAQGRTRSSSNVSGDSHEHVDQAHSGGKGGKGGKAASHHHGQHAKKLAIESDDEVDEMVTVSAAALDALATPALLVPAAVLAVQLQQSQAQSGRSGQSSTATPTSVPGQLLPSVYEPHEFTSCLVTWVGLYPHTNMYHLAFYSTMQGILLAKHEASLALLFKGSKLLSTFIGHYEATALGQHASAHRVLGLTAGSNGASGEDGARDRSGSSTVTSSDGTLIMRMDMPLSPVGKGAAGTPRGGPAGLNATGGKKDAVVTVVTEESIRKADAARKPYTPRSREHNGSGARGIILKTLNTVRLVAQSEPPTSFLSQHLRDHSKWAEFQPKLKEETLSLSKPLVPAPSRPGPNGPGSPGLSNMSANMSALLNNIFKTSNYNNLLSQVSSQGGSLLNKLKGGSSPSSPSSSSSASAAMSEEDSVLGLGSTLAKELGLGNLKPYVADTAAVPAPHAAAGTGGIGGLLAGGKAGSAAKGAKGRSSSVSSTSSSGSAGSALSLMSEGGQEAAKPVVAKVAAGAVSTNKKGGTPIKAGQALAAALSGAILPPTVPSSSRESAAAGGLHDVD